MVYAFVTRARDGGYGRFLIKSVTPIFLRFSEVLRLEGIEVPVAFEKRLPIFEQHFGVDGTVLRELLKRKLERSSIPENEADEWHGRVFPMIDTTMHWIEGHWADSVLAF